MRCAVEIDEPIKERADRYRLIAVRIRIASARPCRPMLDQSDMSLMLDRSPGRTSNPFRIVNTGLSVTLCCDTPS